MKLHVALFVLTFVPLASGAATPGVTNDTILLGQSAALSGPAARLGESMREGALTYFREINGGGGVHGRKIELISLDDGYEPERTIDNTQKLINGRIVFALFGYVGTPTSYAALPLIEASGVPFFGAFTGAQGLREPFSRHVFNIRASYYDETARLVDLVVAQRRKRIAVFYQDDSYGKAGLAGVERAVERHHLGVVALGTVKRNTTDVDAAVEKIAAARPNAVIMISAYRSCAEFIRRAARVMPDVEFLNVSFVGSEALATELGADGNGVVISQVVPFYSDPMYDVAVEFRNALKRQFPQSKPSFNNLEGYIAAKAFVEGLRRAGPDLTRNGLIAALETFRDVDLGRFKLTFTPTDHNGSQLVLLTMIVGFDGTFMLFSSATAAPARK